MRPARGSGRRVLRAPAAGPPGPAPPARHGVGGGVRSAGEREQGGPGCKEKSGIDFKADSP